VVVETPPNRYVIDRGARDSGTIFAASIEHLDQVRGGWVTIARYGWPREVGSDPWPPAAPEQILQRLGDDWTALALIARAQKVGLKCAIIDLQKVLSPEACRRMGVDMHELIFAQPHPRRVRKIIEGYARSEAIGLVVIDAATAPDTEPLQRIMSEVMVPEVSSLAIRTGTLIVFVDAID
jgi:hypothetical protein